MGALFPKLEKHSLIMFSYIFLCLNKFKVEMKGTKLFLKSKGTILVLSQFKKEKQLHKIQRK